jgi:hypothetical protein
MTVLAYLICSRVAGKHASVGELRQKISQTFGLDLTQLRIAKEKHGGVGSLYNKQIITLDDDSKSLTRDLNLLEKSTLYVEEPKDLAGNDTVPDRLQEALSTEANAVEICAFLMESEDAKATEELKKSGQGHNIIVDRRHEILTVREKVAQAFNLPLFGFRILVKQGTMMTEVAGETELIKDSRVSFFSKQTVFVVPGQPLRDGEAMFRFFLLRTRYKPGLHRTGPIIRCQCLAGAPSCPSWPESTVGPETYGTHEDVAVERNGMGHMEEKHVDGEIKDTGLLSSAGSTPHQSDDAASAVEELEKAGHPLGQSIADAFPTEHDFEKLFELILHESTSVTDLRKRVNA